MPWPYSAQQHKEPTEQKSCAYKASFWPWMCQSAGCLPNCMYHLQVILNHIMACSSLTLHLFAFSSPQLFNDSKSSLLPHPSLLQRCNYIRRLKFLSTSVRSLLFLSLQLCTALSFFNCCHHTLVRQTCVLQTEGQPTPPSQNQGGINRCYFSAARPISPLSCHNTCKGHYQRGKQDHLLRITDYSVLKCFSILE